MNSKLINTLATVTTIAWLAGCASQDTKPGELQALMDKQTALQQNQNIASNAAIELNELGEYVDKATTAWQEGEEEQYQQQLYLASRQSDITESVGLTRHYRQQIESMADKRQELMIRAKNAELETTRSRLQTTESQLENKTSELSGTRQALAEKSEELQQLNQLAQSAEQQAVALADELNSVKAEMTQKGMVLTLQDILFEFNQSELKSGADRTISKVAEFLNNNANVEVTIEGFTDSIGSEQYNLNLAKQRAESVAKALTQQGVGAERLTTKSLGEAFPVASNDTAAGRQENRRVELVLNQAE